MFSNTPEAFEKTLEDAMSLMFDGRRDEACQLLLEEKEQAIERGDSTAAALFSSVRGSYLVTMNRDQEALDAYLEAERISGENQHRLTTARHLVMAMARSSEGLKIVDSVLAGSRATGRAGKALHWEAHHLRGLALLAMDRTRDATYELQWLIDHFVDAARELTLVQELAKRGTAPELCTTFLDLVESAARKDADDRVLSEIRRVRGQLQRST